MWEGALNKRLPYKKAIIISERHYSMGQTPYIHIKDDTTMMTQKEMHAAVLAKADEDKGFRAQLLSNPKDAIHQAVGVTIPEGMTVTVHEDSATNSHLVLPPHSKLSPPLPAAVTL